MAANVGLIFGLPSILNKEQFEEIKSLAPTSVKLLLLKLISFKDVFFASAFAPSSAM